MTSACRKPRTGRQLGDDRSDRRSPCDHHCRGLPTAIAARLERVRDASTRGSRHVAAIKWTRIGNERRGGARRRAKIGTAPPPTHPPPPPLNGPAARSRRECASSTPMFARAGTRFSPVSSSHRSDREGRTRRLGRERTVEVFDSFSRVFFFRGRARRTRSHVRPGPRDQRRPRGSDRADSDIEVWGLGEGRRVQRRAPVSVRVNAAARPASA